jgi:hypothetical protein
VLRHLLDAPSGFGSAGDNRAALAARLPPPEAKIRKIGK